MTSTTNAPIYSRKRSTIFLHALLFVFSFSLVFVLGWGGATTVIGGVFREYKSELAKIGGVVVIVFGLSSLGILKIPWLYYDTRPQWNWQRKNAFISSALMGIIFAAGWTPCIGTTLGAILTMGFAQETYGQAMWLSSGYALGLGIPFLIIGLGIDRTTHIARRFQRYIRVVQVISGLSLILIGILLVTNQLTLIAAWAQRHGLYFDLISADAGNPTFIVAVIAGLLSFLSPCVLPLVPAYVGYLSGRITSEV